MEVRKKASFSLRKNIANSLFLFHGAVGQQCSFLSTGSYLTFTNARGKSKSPRWIIPSSNELREKMLLVVNNLGLLLKKMNDPRAC